MPGFSRPARLTVSSTRPSAPVVAIVQPHQEGTICKAWAAWVSATTMWA